MHKNQKLRLIQQISYLLELSQPATSTVLIYYRKFTQAIPTLLQQYSNEIVVCSCIYLVSKIFEDEKKIRDILNAINSAIKMYKIASGKQYKNENQQGNYIKLEYLYKNSQNGSVIDRQQILRQIQPQYQLTMYNELKKQVLQSQQLLLKILKFDFSIAQQKSSNFKQLLGICDQMRLPRNVTEIAIKTYNDLQFTQGKGQVVQWVPGLIYFAMEVWKVYEKVKQQQQNSMKVLQLQKNSKSEDLVNINAQNSQALSKNQNANQNQDMVVQIPQISALNQTKKSKSLLQKTQTKIYQIDKIQWQKLFLVPLKKLQAYSQRVIKYYQKISKQQFEDQQQSK